MIWCMSAALAESVAPVRAPAPVDPLAYAEDLAARGLMDQAWAAFDAAAFEHAGTPTGDRAQLRAAECLWALEQYADAERSLRGDTRAPYVLGQAESRYQLGDLVGARQLLAGQPASSLVDYRVAWIHVRSGELDAAATLLEGIDDPDLPSAAFAAELRDLPELPYKRPALAGVLSAMVPGLGQAYTGRWRDASSAFLVNGLLIAATTELARRELWVSTGVVGLVALSFYTGNIFSAVNGAHRVNAQHASAQLAGLEERYEVSWTLDAQGRWVPTR